MFKNSILLSKLQPPLPGRRSASLWTSPPCIDMTEARTPARARDAAHPRAHRCWSGSDRRAHLGGTERIEDRRRGRRSPGLRPSGASERGERCSERVSPLAAGLKKLRSIHLGTLHLLSPLPLISPSPFDKEDKNPDSHLPASSPLWGGCLTPV